MGIFPQIEVKIKFFELPPPSISGCSSIDFVSPSLSQRLRGIPGDGCRCSQETRIWSCCTWARFFAKKWQFSMVGMWRFYPLTLKLTYIRPWKWMVVKTIFYFLGMSFFQVFQGGYIFFVHAPTKHQWRDSQLTVASMRDTCKVRNIKVWFWR